MFASYEAKNAAMSAQTKTMVRVLEVAYDEMLTKLTINATDLAQGAQDNKVVKKLVKKANKERLSNEELGQLEENLSDQFNQRLVTTGILDLVKVKAFDKKLELIAISRQGKEDFPGDMVQSLHDNASKRDKSEMKKPLVQLWADDSGAYLSVLYPIGTFRIVGYVEAVTNVAYNTREIETVLGTPIEIRDRQGKSSYQSDNWLGDSESKLYVPFLPENEQGESLLEIVLEEDVTEFLESLQNTQFQIIGLFIALGVFGVLLALFLLRTNLFLPMKRLKDAMSAITEGDLTVEIDSLKRQDELGMMTNALVFFVHSFKENKQVSIDASRVKVALQNSATGMLILDENHELIFANECIKQTFATHQSAYSQAFDSSDALALNEGAFVQHFSLLNASEINALRAATEKTEVIGDRHVMMLLAPVLDEHGNRVGTVIEWSDLTEQVRQKEAEEKRLQEERILAAENQRIRQSLDGVAIGVAIVSPGGALAYANDSFNLIQSKVSQDPVHIGDQLTFLEQSNVPALHRSILEGFAQTEIELGNGVFLVTSTPVKDEQGEVIGATLEWIDKTSEAEVESQIDSLIQNAARGLLTERIDTTGKQGFLLAVSQQLNSLLEGVGASMDDTRKIMDALAAGNLNLRINNHYQGTFGEIIDAANETADKLKLAMDDVSQVVAAALEGDLNQRAEETGRQGFFLDLSKSVNGLMENISSTLYEVGEVLQKMSAGELVDKVKGEYQGSFKELSHSINKTVDDLRRVIIEISQSADAVLSASQEISTGNTDLSDRTERQASALEEASSALVEMGQSSIECAKEASQASSTVDKAKEMANHGNEVAERAVAAMNEIADSSEQVMSIIEVINEIAFQTNLLALNAAVEAARAGEHGRGFSVVASEVRPLAQRSANAANQIKSLLVNANNLVIQGKQEVNMTGEQLRSIGSSISDISRGMSEIRAATTEQSDGINETSQAVRHMDDMTQQNAAMVEEIAATSSAMLDQARRMKQSTAYFKV